MQDLTELWKKEEQQPFIGWDFSYLDGRMFEQQAPWSYESRAAVLMQTATALLDMGTGGGERLLALQAHWPRKVVVTEEYPPNIKLAKARLEPLGVTVVDAQLSIDAPMPFANGEFDLVLNRHAGFNAEEVARLLAPGGTFLTQQVHGMWAHDLISAFDRTPQWPESTPAYDVPRLKAAGLEVRTAQEWSGELAFADVGAIVYYLKAVPWLVPGFAVDTHLHHLLQLQRRLEQQGKLVFAAMKYLIEAQKPG